MTDQQLYHKRHGGHGASNRFRIPKILRVLSVLRGAAFGVVCTVIAAVAMVAITLAWPTEAAQSSAVKTVTARRLPQNPLITISSSPTLGDNVNGPAIIRVPPWIQHPLG